MLWRRSSVRIVLPFRQAWNSIIIVIRKLLLISSLGAGVKEGRKKHASLKQGRTSRRGRCHERQKITSKVAKMWESVSGGGGFNHSHPFLLCLIAEKQKMKAITTRKVKSNMFVTNAIISVYFFIVRKLTFKAITEGDPFRGGVIDWHNPPPHH